MLFTVLSQGRAIMELEGTTWRYQPASDFGRLSRITRPNDKHVKSWGRYHRAAGSLSQDGNSEMRGKKHPRYLSV